MTISHVRIGALLFCVAASPVAAVDSALEAELQATIELTQARARMHAQDYSGALPLEPTHLAGHEYLGELHLQEGDTAAAETLLARLEQLCPAGCKERDELAAAIRAAGPQALDAR